MADFDLLICVVQEKDLQNASRNNRNTNRIEAINHEISSIIELLEEKIKKFDSQIEKAIRRDDRVLKWKGRASSDSLRFSRELLEELLENISDILNESSNINSIDTTLIFNKQKDVFLTRLTEFLITRYKIYKTHKKDNTMKNKAEAANEMLELVKELLDGVNQ